MKICEIEIIRRDTGFETSAYTSNSAVPWYSVRSNVKSIVFRDEIVPISTAYWFYDFNNCANINVDKLNTSNVTDMQLMFANTGGSISSFRIVGLDSWDTSKVTNLSCVIHCTDGEM